MLLFENFNEIESICKKYKIYNYTINQDGSIDVDGNVNLNKIKLTNLPLKFNKVFGYFDCSINELISLEGSPNEINGSFFCYENQLTSLEGGPKEVGYQYFCSNNKLTSLEGSPEKINSNFYCNNNQLINLEGGPKEVDGFFDCINNPIYEIFKLFKNYDQFKSLLDDYNYLRGTRIIKARFEQVCLEAGIKMPTEIEGYTII